MVLCLSDHHRLLELSTYGKHRCHRRLNSSFGWSCTADRRFRHGLQDSNACIFYDQGAEMMNHILLGCPFSREVWEAWFRKLHLQHTVVVQDEPAIPWWLRCRKALPKQLRRGFDSLFFLIGWSIWKERNARTFNGVSTSAARLEVSIQEEADAWCMAGYKHLGALMASI